MRRPKNSKLQIWSLTIFFPYINSDENQTVFDKMIDRVKISSALCAATLGK